MVIGPFNGFHVQEIIRVLKERGVEPTVLQDPEALDKIRDKDKDETPNVGINRGLFKSRGDFVYLELPDSTDMASLYPSLEKYGVVAPIAPEQSEILESAEYHCLQCDFISDHPGTCPQHQIGLLEYSEWLAAQFAAGQIGARKRMYLFGAGMFIVIVLAGLRAWKIL